MGLFPRGPDKTNDLEESEIGQAAWKFSEWQSSLERTCFHLISLLKAGEHTLGFLLLKSVTLAKVGIGGATFFIFSSPVSNPHSYYCKKSQWNSLVHQMMLDD